MTYYHIRAWSVAPDYIVKLWPVCVKLTITIHGLPDPYRFRAPVSLNFANDSYHSARRNARPGVTPAPITKIATATKVQHAITLSI
jgi:hypothetical protein